LGNWKTSFKRSVVTPRKKNKQRIQTLITAESGEERGARKPVNYTVTYICLTTQANACGRPRKGLLQYL